MIGATSTGLPAALMRPRGLADTAATPKETFFGLRSIFCGANNKVSLVSMLVGAVGCDSVSFWASFAFSEATSCSEVIITGGQNLFEGGAAGLEARVLPSELGYGGLKGCAAGFGVFESLLEDGELDKCCLALVFDVVYAHDMAERMLLRRGLGFHYRVIITTNSE